MIIGLGFGLEDTGLGFGLEHAVLEPIPGLCTSSRGKMT